VEVVDGKAGALRDGRRHHRTMAAGWLALVAEEASRSSLRGHRRLGQRGLRRGAPQVRTVDATELAHAARPRRIAAGLRVAEVAQVQVALQLRFR